tara:strand:- start:63 stop:464 length:402 start_codon:yes stop_codon:yes gene_type:complete
MAAKLKDTKGQKYKLSYRKESGELQDIVVIAGKTLVRELEFSKLITGSVVAKTGDRFHALFEFQRDTALQVWTLMENDVKKVKFPEAIEKFKINCQIKKEFYEDLYILDPNDTATGKQWFLKGHGCFVNNNTL